MGETFLPWLLFLLYVLAIIGLTWWNRRRAATMSIFAVGTRSLPPFLVGLSLAANMTSVATFVINPGLVHAFGCAGVVGYGIAAPLGILANDLYGSLARAAGVAAERIAGRLLPIGRGFLVVLAPVTFLLARDQILTPSLSVAIFARNGVYGLFAGGVQGARVDRGLSTDCREDQSATAAPARDRPSTGSSSPAW